MKLSVELEKWRADRPDEWKMDEFVRNAEKLETERDALAATVKAGISERERYYSEIAELEHLRDALAAKVVEVTAERDELAAQAGLEGFVAGFKLGTETPKPTVENCHPAGMVDFVSYQVEKIAKIKANQYADSIRKGE